MSRRAHRLLTAVGLVVGAMLPGAAFAAPGLHGGSGLPGKGLGLTPPVILSAPTRIGYGGTLTLDSPDSKTLSRVVLVPAGLGGILPGGPHTDLAIVSRSSRSLTASEPASPSVTAPGAYLLFVQAPGQLGTLTSLGWPLTLVAPAPTPSVSPTGTAPTPAGSTGPGATSSGGDRTSSAAESGPSSQSKPAKNPASKAGTPDRAKGRDAEALEARKASGRGPLAGLPWIVVVLATFALVVWRLVRIAEPVDQQR